MANMKYAVGQPHQALARLKGDFYNSSLITLTSSTPLATHPVANLIDEHIVKSLRCTNFASSLTIGFDLGVAGVENPAGVLIEGINFSDTINIVNDTQASLATSGTVTTLVPVQNKRTGRYGGFVEISSGAVDREYWGIKVGGGGSAISTAEYQAGWEVGRITWVGKNSLHEMPQNWQLPVGQATQYEGAQRVLAGGKMESKSSSGGFNVIDLTAQFDRNKGDNIEDDIGAMARTSPEDRYLIWFNRGDASEAYLCTKIDFSGNIDEFPVISVDMGLREAI